MINRNRAKVAGFNTPGASITFLGVNVDDPGLRILCESVPGAGCNAGGVFARAACHSGDEHFIDTHRADSAPLGIEFTRFCIGADIFTQLTANT